MNEYLPYLVSGLAAMAVLTLTLLVRDVLERRRLRWERRLRGGEEDEGGGPTLVELAKAGKPDGWAEQMDSGFQEMVHRTGLGMTVAQALGLMTLAGAAVALAVVFWRNDLELIGLGLLLGLLLPLGIFWLMQRRWQMRLQSQLPDAFFLLARSLRAGLSLDQAVTLVGEQGVRPLADEFRKAGERTRLGLPIIVALEMMAERIRLTDFNIFLSVVALHRQVGGNLSLLLDRVATNTRDRNQFRGTFQAATALGRATALFIGVAAPGILLVYALLQPDYLMRFVQNAAGLMALAVAITLQLIGGVWIYYLLRVDY